jgi:hypothetical protein
VNQMPDWKEEMNRLQAHRASRHQAVFRSMPVPVWLEDPQPVRRSAFLSGLERARLGLITRRAVPSLARRMTSRRLGRLARRQPFSRLAATVTRPVGDAVITLQILRIR